MASPATPYTNDSSSAFFGEKSDLTGSWRTPSTRSAPSRPPKSPYDLRNLLHIPRRLFFPPSPRAPEIPTLGDKTTGVVRSAERIKLKDVTLPDLLAGRHLPPLTVKDFEDYLCFVELAAENLYFDAFLKEYTRIYSLEEPGKRTPAHNLALVESYHLALDAFFEPSSPLEVNVSGDVRRALDQRVAALPALQTEPFLPPSAFEKVHTETNKSLDHSFHAFLLYNVRNAERNRARFAKFVGAMTWALGLLPTIICAVLDKHRAWRALGIPLWWFGFVVLMGGVHRTCLVVYLFGDNRQLRPWELIRAPASSASSSTGGSGHHRSNSGDQASLGSSSPDSTDLEKGSPSSDSTPWDRSPSPDFAFTAFNHFPTRKGSVGTTVTRPPGPDRKHSSSGSDKFHYSPSVIQPTLMVSSPTFASLTPVLDPVVRRAQWETVATGAVYGVIAAALTAAVCMSVPNRHR